MANAPASITTPDREKLRADRRLRPLKTEEQGTALDLLSAGVYGFTFSPGTDGIPLFLGHHFQSFEVHKMPDGAVHTLGFMSESDAQLFETSKNTVELKLYPEPYGEARQFVTVPQERILKAKPVSRDNGNWMGFLCLPKE